jgi:integrase
MTGKDKIYKNEAAKNGKPYWFQVMVNGKRRTRRGFRTKGEASKARAELETQLHKGEYVDPSRVSYGQYFQEWLEGRDNIEETTRELYRSFFNNHINPVLGETALSKLTALDIKRLIKSLRQKKLSDGMVQRVYATVNASLNSAVAMDILAKNAAAKIPKEDKPRVEQKERQIWGNDSIRHLLEKGKNDTRYWIAVFVAVMTAMRQGEILALRWSDIDFDKAVLYVRRSLRKDKVDFKKVKTASSRRTISLSPLTLAVLKEQQRIVQAEKASHGDKYEDYDLVVCSGKGTPARAAKVLEAWYRLCKKHKPIHEPDITFHDLRHQSASIMLNEREDIRVVSKRLGHSTVMTTLNVYSHLLPTAQQEAAMSLDKSVGFHYEPHRVGIRDKPE